MSVEWKKFWKTLLFDIGFFLVFFLVSFLVNTVLKSWPYLTGFLVLVYLVFVLFLYTFFKYKILRTLMGEGKRKIKHFVILHFLFFLVLFSLSGLSYLLIKTFILFDYVKWYMGGVGLILSLGGYYLLQNFQVAFFRGERRPAFEKEHLLLVLGEVLAVGIIAVFIGSDYPVLGIFLLILLVLMNAYNRMLFSRRQ